MRVGHDLAAEQQLPQEDPRCRAGLEGGPEGSGQIFTGAELRLPPAATATPGLAWAWHPREHPGVSISTVVHVAAPQVTGSGLEAVWYWAGGSVGSWVAVWDEVDQCGRVCPVPP